MHEKTTKCPHYNYHIHRDFLQRVENVTQLSKNTHASYKKGNIESICTSCYIEMVALYLNLYIQEKYFFVHF